MRDVYALGRQLPRSEIFGLTSQLQRAALSVPQTLRRAMGASTGGSICTTSRLRTDR
ncbi:MAG: four helix bundle protein [Gemmatimonadota bacterium]|nr:four helix bundle protein [Gemmatimonadota bacterium]